MAEPQEAEAQGRLPDFLIIGTQKGGTTFQYNLLRQQRRFKSANKKEVHYFDTLKFSNGLEWYQRQFPPPETTKNGRVLTGEASPFYMFHPLVPRRVAETLPEIRLIAMIRNPVDRAFSDYQHKVRQEIEHLSFEEAVDAEEERLRGEWEKVLTDDGYISPNLRRYSYVSRGIYVDQLKEWHRYFDPEQLLILRSEDFFEDPIGVTKQVQRFVGLPRREPDIDAVKGRNVGGYKAEMASETRHRLQEYFEPHNQRLYDYLGRDFGW